MSFHDRVAAVRRGLAMARALRVTRHGLGLACDWAIEHRNAAGELLWSESGKNLVVDVGINYLLESGLKTNTLYVGLMSSSPTVAAGDTMGSHSGWTEFTTYSESVRQTLTLGTAASKSIDNSAAKATFSINGGGGTVGGAFVSSNSTKSGTSGTLVNGKAFASDRAVVAGDTLTVQLTYTGSSS